MGAFARWRALSRGQRWLTMQSCLAVVAAVVAIRVLGLERSLRTASRPVKHRTPRLASLARDGAKTVIGEVVSAIDRAGRYAPGGSCLPKSLALAWMLRRSGIAAEVRIGVKTAGQFEAHAWVEHDGVAVQDVPLGYASILS